MSQRNQEQQHRHKKNELDCRGQYDKGSMNWLAFEKPGFQSQLC